MGLTLGWATNRSWLERNPQLADCPNASCAQRANRAIAILPRNSGRASDCHILNRRASNDDVSSRPRRSTPSCNELVPIASSRWPGLLADAHPVPSSCWARHSHTSLEVPYQRSTSGGGGRLRFFAHSRLIFRLALVRGTLSMSGMKICSPACGVMRV